MNSKSSSASLVDRALAIALEAHQGQTDKVGQPYILHPLRVLQRMQTGDEQLVAILHDVVEDSDWTLDQLRQEGFSDAVVEAVDALTRREGEAYEELVERAIHNPLACRVKIADLEDNMSLMRLKEIDERTLERLARYLRAWQRAIRVAHLRS
jgi:(p)ppGpp synthase/HD superfamily hydrolase